MSRVPLFEDLGLDLQHNLLEKPFLAEAQNLKLKWRGVTKSGVVLNTSFKKNLVTGESTAVVKPSYVFAPWFTTVCATLSTTKDLKVRAHTVAPIEGLSTYVTAQIRKQEPFGLMAIDYRHELGSLSLSTDIGRKQGTTVKASVVTGFLNCFAGVKAEYLIGADNAPSAMKEIKGTVAHRAGDTEMHASYTVDMRPVDDVRNLLSCGFMHRVRPGLVAGALLDADLNKRTPGTMTLATSYRLGEDTVVGVKADTNGVVSGSLVAAHWNSDTTLTLSTTVDTNNLGGKNATKIGAQVTLGDRGVHLGHTHPIYFKVAGYDAVVLPTPLTPSVPAAVRLGF